MLNLIDGLVQDCSISIANTLETLQSCIKPSIFSYKSVTSLEFLTVSSINLLSSWYSDAYIDGLMQNCSNPVH